MGDISTLIKIQQTKNGVSGKRTNISELLTLPVYKKDALGTVAAKTVKIFTNVLSYADAVKNSVTDFFIYKNGTKLYLYEVASNATSPKITGRYTFTDFNNKYPFNNVIFEAAAEGLLTPLNIFDDATKKLYIAGIEETFNPGETFISDSKLFVALTASSLVKCDLA